MPRRKPAPAIEVEPAVEPAVEPVVEDVQPAQPVVPQPAPQRFKRVGSRADVVAGLAHHTSGGLTADDLVVRPNGAIVSLRRSELGRATAAARGGVGKPAS